MRSAGRITFERFMELALYHPLHGYYSSAVPRIGPEGDYYTSTDVSPLFGATIGRQLREMWELLGEPRPFTVLEYGSGKGLLAADILGWAGAAHPGFYAATRYLIAERSAGLREYQRRRLVGLPVEWVEAEAVPELSITGCVLSNEVADALPFHRVRGVGGDVAELWVAERGGELREEPGELSSPRLRDYLAAAGVSLAEGQDAEVCPRAAEWMRAQLHTLRAGFAIVVDYGDRAERLYGGRYPRGTLACYHRHTRNEEPFARIGKQDITAHVDFTGLASAVRRAGGEVAGYTTQAYFLAGLGLGEALLTAQDRAQGRAEWERERAAVEQLIRPDGLGGFRVLIARKGTSAAPLRGLGLAREPI